MPTAISVSTRVKPRLARRPAGRERERRGLGMSVSGVAIQQARQPGTPAGVQERTRPMTLTTWCTARPSAIDEAQGAGRRARAVHRIEGDRGDVGPDADPVGRAEDDGLDLERAAGAGGRRRIGAAALRRGAGVDHPAGAAGRVVEADADRLVARDRFGAHELQVGGEGGCRGVEPAAVDEVDQAGHRRGGDDRGHGDDDHRLDQREAARALLRAGRGVLRVHAKHCRNPRRNSRSRARGEGRGSRGGPPPGGPLDRRPARLRCPGSAGGTRRRPRSCGTPRRSAHRRPCRCA